MNSNICQLIFDDKCAFCRDCKSTIVDHSRPGHITTYPWSSPHALDLLEQHGIDREQKASFILIQGNRCYQKGDAIVLACKQMRFPWRMLSLFSCIPKKIRDKLYDVVARNRHRYGCSDDCELGNS